MYTEKIKEVILNANKSYFIKEFLNERSFIIIN